MLKLSAENFRYALDDNGCCASFYNSRTCHEYVYLPGEIWKLIYSQGDRMECPVYSRGQTFAVQQRDDGFTLVYEALRSDDRLLDITLRLHFSGTEQGLSVVAELENRTDVRVAEFQLTAVSGVRALEGNSEKDRILWPSNQGQLIPNPAFNDLSSYAGYRKYERHDQLHTDLDLMYPGGGSMQWYDLCNDDEGIYVGSHDHLHHTVCLHVEREVRQNVLRLGVIHYPFLDSGESWSSRPVLYTPHRGDWHAGARIYRQWIESAGWTAPQQSDWAKHFQGWLRVILRTHHGENNWTFHDIPTLFDEAQASGLDTLFLLGWEQGGFARLWPDYVVSEDLGGEQTLRDGIDYVHSKGGRILLFLSYFLIDHESRFYREEGGDACTIRSLWGEDIPFAETYCGEGTYRKVGNPAMAMYAACPSSPLWQRKMLDSAKVCLDLGADGVLYDIGGYKPYFCFHDDHPHAKPSHSHADKDLKYKELRDFVKSYGRDRTILMEHNVDIFGQHMDITHPCGFSIRPEAGLPVEMYRYTFPEIVMTNREMGQDEQYYKQNINYSFVQGLAYDMTIFRCCGTLSDIPTYAAYMKEKIALRQQHAKHLIFGRYVDNEGFHVDDDRILAKGYMAQDGTLAVALWNMSEEPVSFTLCADGGTPMATRLEGLEAGVWEL